MERSTHRFARRFGVEGVGRVGTNAVRYLLQQQLPVDVSDPGPRARADIAPLLRAKDSVAERPAAVGSDPVGGVVILAGPARTHAGRALALVSQGVSVVSTSDDPQDIAALLALDSLARSHSATVVAGAGLSPGFSCLLAQHMASDFTEVTELSVWVTGTAGPACARRHHRSLKETGIALVEGEWVHKRGGSGRDLTWFPGTLGAHDCYRGSRAEPLLLHRLFPNARRISARVSANRRDRLTSRLPMLRKPHPDGGPGGVRIELRGEGSDGYQSSVLGAMAFPSIAAGTVAAVIAVALAKDGVASGAMGAGEINARPGALLARLHDAGLRAERYAGLD